MPIPFPPDGPQVQAAMSKMPGGVLQQYATGRPPQPTGQVTPGPMGAAAEALNARGAIGAANQRQSAMNNKVSDSTVFQQKDMQIQQAMQALKQKEQQLGVLGALMAKKAQDMQTRESAGVGSLPLPENMFTAMDGGVVFSGGGAVQRFNGVNSSTVKDRPILTNEGLAADFERLLNYFGVPFTSFEEGMARTKEGQEALRRRFEMMPELGAMQTASRGEERKDEETKPGESKPRKEDKPNLVPVPGAGVASLTRRDFSADMEKLKPYMTGIDRSDETKLINEYLEYQKKVAAEVAKGNLSEEKAKEMMDARKAEMAAQYSKYTKDRGTRQEEMISAMRGEEPTFQERLGAGLKRLPVDLKGVRLGGLFGALGAGAAESDAEYRKRMREAAVKSAEIKELNAKADLLEERGQMVEADRVRKEAEARKKDEAGLEAGALEAKARGLASLQQLAGKDRDRVATAATSLLSSELNEDAQKRLAEYRAKLEAQYREPRGPTSLEQRVALYKSDPKLYKVLFGDKESSKPPSPRDIIAAKQYAANLPLEQLDLSNDVKMAIKNKAKSLNDPTSDIYQEIQKARDRAAQNILFLGIPEADDLLKRQPR